ncbi:MAG: type II secretion system protein GspG [Planctomycetes bacterium]|nr:type II secretion system protein GspG [Planctomycetota bacterium]
MKNKKTKLKHGAAGFTLIEIMAVVLIIGLLIGTVGQPIVRMLFKGTQARVKMDIKTLEGNVQYYKNEMFRYPDSWEDMMEMEGDPILERAPLDPWSNEYFYEPPTSGSNFIIGTYGADGEVGGEGENADITNETLREAN